MRHLTLSIIVFIVLFQVAVCASSNVSTTEEGKTLYPKSNTQAYVDKVFMSQKELNTLINSKITEKINQNQALFNGNIDTLVTVSNYWMTGLGIFITIVFFLFQYFNSRSFERSKISLKEDISKNTEKIKIFAKKTDKHIEDKIKLEMINYVSDNLKNIEEQSIKYAKYKLDTLEQNTKEEMRDTLELERKILFNIDKHYIGQYTKEKDASKDMFLEYINVRYAIAQVMQGDISEISVGLDKLKNFPDINHIMRQFIDRIEERVHKLYSEHNLYSSILEYKEILTQDIT